MFCSRHLSLVCLLAVPLHLSLGAETISPQPSPISGEASSTETLFLAGRAAFRGEGAPKDDAKAFALFGQAAELGHAKAQNNLALMYETGRGTSQDLAKAEYWYRKSAEQGAILAEESLGQLLMEGGPGISKDPEAAAIWLRKAAEQGSKKAAFSLGTLYFYGAENFAKDYRQAALWLGPASIQGNKSAQNTMGVIYEQGLGTSPDLPLALQNYRKAAEQNESRAQTNLGRLYMEGIGVAKDPVQAYAWLLLGSLNGDVGGAKLLSVLEQEISPAQRAEAEKRATRFRERSQQTHPVP